MKEIETNSQLINLKMKNIELSKVAASILSLQDEVRGKNLMLDLRFVR